MFLEAFLSNNFLFQFNVIGECDQVYLLRGLTEVDDARASAGTRYRRKRAGIMTVKEFERVDHQQVAHSRLVSFSAEPFEAMLVHC